jgi:hypothetical protein
MQRTKSSKTDSNYDTFLQDIYDCLGVNYAFYHECLVTIIRAAARHDAASAWVEQTQQVMERIEEVAGSHAGVLFLLLQSF